MSYKGQVSTEMLVSVAIILVLFVLVLVNNSLMTDSSQIVADYSKDKINCIKFAYALSNVYSSGNGTETYLELDKNATIFSSAKTIRLGNTDCIFLSKTSDKEILAGKVTMKNIDGNVVVTQ